MNEENSGHLRTSDKEEQISYSISVNTLLIENGTFLVITCDGKDEENWAGNYGARFKEDRLVVALNS